MGKKLKDIHIFLEEDDLKEFKTRLCTHKGDLTWHFQCAVKEYLARRSPNVTSTSTIEESKEVPSGSSNP